MYATLLIPTTCVVCLSSQISRCTHCHHEFVFAREFGHSAHIALAWANPNLGKLSFGSVYMNSQWLICFQKSYQFDSELKYNELPNELHSHRNQDQINSFTFHFTSIFRLMKHHVPSTNIIVATNFKFTRVNVSAVFRWINLIKLDCDVRQQTGAWSMGR